jgi:hypothetical protein
MADFRPSCDLNVNEPIAQSCEICNDDTRMISGEFHNAHVPPFVVTQAYQFSRHNPYRSTLISCSLQLLLAHVLSLKAKKQIAHHATCVLNLKKYLKNRTFFEDVIAHKTQAITLNVTITSRHRVKTLCGVKADRYMLVVIVTFMLKLCSR